MTRTTITTRRTKASRVPLPSFMYHPVTTPLRGPFSAALLSESAPFLPRLAVKKLVPCSFGEIPSRCVPATLIIGLVYRRGAYEGVKSALLFRRRGFREVNASVVKNFTIREGLIRRLARDEWSSGFLVCKPKGREKLVSRVNACLTRLPPVRGWFDEGRV